MRSIWYLLIPVTLVFLLKIFVIDVYRVSSNSMNETLEVGDIVVIDKLSKGTLFYTKSNKSLNPFLSKLFDRNYSNSFDSFKRLLAVNKGFKRNEIVVFNNPLYLPELMIKRIIAVPGDSLKITDSNISVNNIVYAPSHLRNKNYVSKAFSKDEQLIQLLTTDAKDSKVVSIYPEDISFLNTKLSEQNIFIPKRGVTIELTTANFNLYKRIINDYEKRNFINVDGEVFEKGKRVNRYTFKENYYYVLGDNINNSADSRAKGFIPEFNIIGKTILIL
ncbi:signal peptidase I [Aquimarina sp. M1]